MMLNYILMGLILLALIGCGGPGGCPESDPACKQYNEPKK